LKGLNRRQNRAEPVVMTGVPSPITRARLGDIVSARAEIAKTSESGHENVRRFGGATKRGGPTEMSRFGIVTAVAFIAAIASARADEQVWTVDNWPDDIRQIP
jgi:hypothetical protein